MTIKEIAFRMENVRLRMWELNSLVFVLDTSIAEGANDCKGYEGAAYALSTMTGELEQEINELTGAVFETMRAG